MDFHDIVNKNTYLAYKGPETEINRLIKAENFDWNNLNPKSLSSLCITQIATDWNGKK